MNNKGKAYANRKSIDRNPLGDLYVTPRSLMWVAKPYFEKLFSKEDYVLDPCCGIKNNEMREGLMAYELEKIGYKYVYGNDIINSGESDYLDMSFEHKSTRQIVMNPPFYLWDEFVEKAKFNADIVFSIGRLNYLGTDSRLKKGLWESLAYVLPFNRYVDYQTPLRKDGCFHVGAMATAWFIWIKHYVEKPMIDILDVQKYASLGAFKQKKEKSASYSELDNKNMDFLSDLNY